MLESAFLIALLFVITCFSIIFRNMRDLLCFEAEHDESRVFLHDAEQPRFPAREMFHDPTADSADGGDEESDGSIAGGTPLDDAVRILCYDDLLEGYARNDAALRNPPRDWYDMLARFPTRCQILSLTLSDMTGDDEADIDELFPEDSALLAQAYQHHFDDQRAKNLNSRENPRKKTRDNT